jgi:hypothetical protein
MILVLLVDDEPPLSDVVITEHNVGLAWSIARPTSTI